MEKSSKRQKAGTSNPRHKVFGNALAPKPEVQAVHITPPNMRTAVFRIEGTAPFVQLRFSAKVQRGLIDTMSEEGNPRKKKNRSPRNYQEEYEGAMYEAPNAKRGIPASAFRNAAISACRLVKFHMTLAKLSIFIVADTFDKLDGTPLVYIEGEPELHQGPVRNANGNLDIRTRAMWRKWGAMVKVRYDADQFNATDIANLMARVGQQVGIGEGRPDGREGAGMGWGLFDIVND